MHVLRAACRTAVRWIILKCWKNIPWWGEPSSRVAQECAEDGGARRAGGCFSMVIWRNSPLWGVTLARSWLPSSRSCSVLSLVPVLLQNETCEESKWMEEHAAAIVGRRSWALALVPICLVKSFPASRRNEWERGYMSEVPLSNQCAVFCRLLADRLALSGHCIWKQPHLGLAFFRRKMVPQQ